MSAMLLSEIFPPKVGGSGRWFWEVYRRMPNSEVVIAAGEDPKAETFDKEHDLNLHRVPLSIPSRLIRPGTSGYYWRAFRKIRRIAQENHVTVIHAGRTLPEGVIAWMLKRATGLPYILFAHGEEVNLSNAETTPPWHKRSVYNSRELGFVVGRVLFNAKAIIANSKNTASILHNRWSIPDQRVHVVHPGVDIDRFIIGHKSSEKRKHLGWDNRTVVLTVGRLQQRKGHDMLIRAIPQIRAQYPDLLYAIVGSGEELGPLKKLAESLNVSDHVLFHTDLSDKELLDCYHQCDVFALPNREISGDIEGFGIVLVEAQACGKPVLAGDSGGTRETMEVGETGLIVDCTSPEPLAKGIVNLLEMSKSETIEQRTRQWAERFDWSKLSEDFTAACRTINSR